MRRRLRILRHWLMGMRNGIGLFRMLRFAFGRTCVPKGMRFIESIEDRDDFMLVRIRGLKCPIWVPSEFERFRLCQVITEQFYDDDWHRYEVGETVVRADDVVLDAGAAEGLFALMVAGRCEKVFAIEPLPRFVEALRRTFEQFENVEVIDVALGDAEGEAYLLESGIASRISATGDGTKVVVTTIDSLFAHIPFTYLKADLEGFEMLMLRGAAECIRRYRPRIAITTYHREQHEQEMRDFLLGLVPEYRFESKGLEDRWGAPVMLHAWTLTED